MRARNPTSPSYKGLKPASPWARIAARGSSRKVGTRCEVLLANALHPLGLRFRTNVPSLPGCPDIVFRQARVAVFCDGDFWHGRNLSQRVSKLAKGHNAAYWIAKIQANARRDRRHARALRAAGWKVFRVWEGSIVLDPDAVAARIARALPKR